MVTHASACPKPKDLKKPGGKTSPKADSPSGFYMRHPALLVLLLLPGWLLQLWLVQWLLVLVHLLRCPPLLLLLVLQLLQPSTPIAVTAGATPPLLDITPESSIMQKLSLIHPLLCLCLYAATPASLHAVSAAAVAAIIAASLLAAVIAAAAAAAVLQGRHQVVDQCCCVAPVIVIAPHQVCLRLAGYINGCTTRFGIQK